MQPRLLGEIGLVPAFGACLVYLFNWASWQNKVGPALALTWHGLYRYIERPYLVVSNNR